MEKKVNCSFVFHYWENDNTTLLGSPRLHYYPECISHTTRDAGRRRGWYERCSRGINAVEDGPVGSYCIYRPIYHIFLKNSINQREKLLSTNAITASI